MKMNILIAVVLFQCAALLTACDNTLDIQQAYDFKVETMPVQSKIIKGETAEIRCTLIRSGRFEEDTYTIRYFQPSGKGSLKMDDGAILKPNDRYPLTKEVFRLYYTSQSIDQQKIDIVVESKTGKKHEMSFSFNNESEEKKE